MLHRVTGLLLVAVCLAAPASAQTRALRLFFSTLGLSDPFDPQSPAVDPSPEFTLNPHAVVAPNQATRLYIWAKLEPAGPPNNVVLHGVSLRARIAGAGGGVAGFQFWNYHNPNYTRWQQFSQSGNATSVTFAGASVVTGGGGIGNTNPQAMYDAQHRRYADDGVTRIDASLLGSVDFAGSQAGALLQVFMAVGASGIAQSGAPPIRIYLGWGDEEVVIHGNDFGVESPIPEATILVTPEPHCAALIAVAALLFMRRCHSPAVRSGRFV
jgi:hypothetical protein